MHTTRTTARTAWTTAALALTAACTTTPSAPSDTHPPPAAARTTDCGRTPTGVHITADLPSAPPATACTTARHVADAYQRTHPAPGDDLPNFTINVDGATWACRRLDHPRPHGRCLHPDGGDVTLT